MSEFVTFLGNGDYKLLQDDDGYLFSADSVLLANLAQIGAKDSVLDLGSGSGIISTLIAVKKHAAKIVGIELDDKACGMAARSAKMNKLEDKLSFVCADVRQIKTVVQSGEYDKVVCNPPYFDFDDGNTSVSARTTARKVTGATLEDFVAAAAYSLKNGGDFFIVYPAASLADLTCILRANGLEPKRAILVYPKLSKGLDTVIVSARKGGGKGMTFETLVIMDEEGRYTERVRELYN